MASRQIRVEEVNDTSKVLDQCRLMKDQSLVNKGDYCAFFMVDSYEKLISLGAAVNFATEAIA